MRRRPEELDSVFSIEAGGDGGENSLRGSGGRGEDGEGWK
jgi:hypothetical protein